MTLFDTTPRSDPSPARYEEGTFAFLNRVEDPFFAAVRETLEAWFERLPVATQTSFRARARSGGWRSVFWELYLHEALCRCGLTVEYEPELCGSSRSPDFLVSADNGSFFVEAVSVDNPHEDWAAERRRARILDALDKTDSPDFFLWLEFEAEGRKAPSVSKFRPALEEWLRVQDPERMKREYESGGTEAVSPFVWTDRGWRVIIRPVPKKPETRGDRSHRPVGASGPSEARFIDDRAALLRPLSKKGRGYGEWDRPFVIAIDFHSVYGLDEEDVEGTLYGRTVDRTWLPPGHPERRGRLDDGFWFGGGGRVHTRVSAVMVAAQLQPWTAGEVAPTLWHNPWASRPLDVRLPWCAERRFDPDTGKLTESPSDVLPRTHLGLSPEWPGPEGLFAGR